MIIFEALVIGLIGTVFGVIVGIALGRETVNLILQTINDLYYVTTVKSVSIPSISVIKGVLLGIFATIFVSIPPAIEAMQVTPRTAKIRSGYEGKIRKNLIILSFFARHVLPLLTYVLSIFIKNIIFFSNVYFLYSVYYFVDNFKTKVYEKR